MEKKTLANHPRLLKEWNDKMNAELEIIGRNGKNIILPSDIPAQSHKKVWWKCKKGHEWKQVIRDVTRNYSRSKTEVCKYCTYDGSNPYLKNVITTN